MYECEGCGQDRGYTDAGPAKLCGGFYAKLCTTCLNKWDEHIRPRDVWGRLLAVRVAQSHLELSAAAGIQPDYQEVKAAICERNNVEVELFAEAKRFLKTLGRHGAGGDEATLTGE